MRRVWVASLLLVFIFIPASYILASEPPENITIDTVKVFENLAEDGDSLYVFHSSMPFASDNYPSTPASESTIFRLYDTDGVTIKQTGVPYVYPYFERNGYGEGIGSFYFGASDNAPAWDAAVIINIGGRPAYYSLTQETPPFDTSYYVTENQTQEENRALLKEYILLECDKLSASYADTGVILKATTESGQMLSGHGENYFRGTIEGLQTLCPELFYIQTLIPEKMAVVPYDMSLMDTYTGRLDDDDLGSGLLGIGALIGGLGGPFVAAAMTFIGVFALCIWTTRKGWGTEIGMLGGALITVGAAILVGDIVFMIMMILALVATMVIVWLTLLKKA